MPKRRSITRYKGEGLSITGPATIRVGRRVRLFVDAAPGTQVERLPAPQGRQRQERSPSDSN